MVLRLQNLVWMLYLQNISIQMLNFHLKYIICI